MQKSIAKLISIIFGPVVLIVLLSFLVAYKETGDSIYALKWQIFSSLFVLASGILVYLGEWIGIFSDPEKKRKEREKFYKLVIMLLSVYIVFVVFDRGFLSVPIIVGLGALSGVFLFSFFN